MSHDRNVQSPQTYAHLITRGEEGALSSIKAHHDAPLMRYVLLEKEKVQGDGGIRIVTHIINDLPNDVPPYCDLHWHDFDEINLVLSEDASLRYRIKLEDEVYEVGSPTTVYIPKGVRHSAEVISGKGVFIFIGFTNEYKSFQ